MSGSAGGWFWNPTKLCTFSVMLTHLGRGDVVRMSVYVGDSSPRCEETIEKGKRIRKEKKQIKEEEKNQNKRKKKKKKTRASLCHYQRCCCCCCCRQHYYYHHHHYSGVKQGPNYYSSDCSTQCLVS